MDIWQSGFVIQQIFKVFLGRNFFLLVGLFVHFNLLVVARGRDGTDRIGGRRAGSIRGQHEKPCDGDGVQY